MIKRYEIKEDIVLRDFLEQTDLSSNLITNISNGNGRFIVNNQNVNKSYLLKQNDLLEIVSRTAEENVVENLNNYQTKNEVNYLEDQISYKTALESIVLLKNDKKLLPLKNKKIS